MNNPMQKQSIKTNATIPIWNEHYMTYPIHKTMQLGIIVNIVFPFLLIIILLMRHYRETLKYCLPNAIEEEKSRMAVAVSTIQPYQNFSSSKHRNINQAFQHQVVESMNEDNYSGHIPMQKGDEYSMDEYESMYIGTAIFLNSVKLASASFWHLSQHADNYDVAVVWMVFYTTCAVLFQVANLTFLPTFCCGIKSWRKKHAFVFILIITFVIIFYVDYFLISIGSQYVTHAANNPVDYMPMINEPERTTATTAMMPVHNGHSTTTTTQQPVTKRHRRKKWFEHDSY